MSVDAPDFDTAPAPVIFPVNVWSDAEAYERVPDEPMVISPAYDAGVLPAPSVPVTEIVPPEALIVVVPLYVFAPASVRVPVPDLIRLPVDVAIGSATETLPVFASTIRLNVPVMALPDDGSNVNVPESD